MFVCFQIIAAGLGLPLIGYISGAMLASNCRQPRADVLAISIETGIQNTGIAIFMLQTCLHQPEADLTTGKLYRILLIYIVIIYS